MNKGCKIIIVRLSSTPELCCPEMQACLELLGVAGASTDKPGGNARKLAMIIASAVMAAELSLLSALVQGHLIRAHMQYNRKAPSASETKAAD